MIDAIAGARCRLLLLVLAVWAPTGAAWGQQMPHLQRQGSATQLMVDGKPMLMLGGELGNSSASSREDIAARWPSGRHLNTVLAPVYWELLEPEEGRFDFALVDALLQEARAHEMRLVLLWFGSWKNSMSSYAPSWVKRGQERFPRAQDGTGRGLDILSAFSEANVQADARAFAALLKYLREKDGDDHTVVMIQVENEIGMIPEARDHAPAAEAAFRVPVPETLTRYLDEHRGRLHPALSARWEEQGRSHRGTWTEIFGPGTATEEIFTAWHYARYVETVAAAGKAVYALPMYVNAALMRPGRTPGEYPSGGPLPHLYDVWRAAAPSVDFLAPDIYFPNFTEWASAYHLTGNPLFIPEADRAGSVLSPANAWLAFGAYDAIGFSPFSIEDANGSKLLSETYAALESLAPLVTQHNGRGTMTGVRPPVAYDGTADTAPQTVAMGGYNLTVSFVDPWTAREAQQPETHGGLIIALDEGAFLIAGTGLTITFAPRGEGRERAGIDRIEEGTYVQGVWRSDRVLNGDQSHQGRHLRLPPGAVTMQRLTLYKYR